MKKINANLLFFIYFVAITYAFAKDINILTSVPSYDVEHPITSFLISLLNKYGLPPYLIRTYLGSLFAVYIANYLAVVISDDPDSFNNTTIDGISTYLRIIPIIILNLYIQFSFFIQSGLSENLTNNFLYPMVSILIIPIFIVTSLYAKNEAYKVSNFETEFNIEVIHLYWLVFPAYYYMVRIINEWLLALEMLKYTFTLNFFGSIFAMISVISFMVYIVPMYLAIKILKKDYLPNINKISRFLINTVIIVLGYLICGSIAEGIDWMKNYFKFLY